MEQNHHVPAALTVGNIQDDDDSWPLLADEEEHRPAFRTKGWLPCVPRRFIIFFLSYTGLLSAMSFRTMFNVALVAMVNFTAADSHANDSADECPAANTSLNYTKPVNTQEGEFDWDVHTQQTLIAALYWGYPILQIPAGITAERFGAKKVLGISVLVSCVVTMLQPLIAKWNVTALIVGRMVIGLTSGMAYPTVFALCGLWVPEREKGRIITIIGTGILGILWCIFWMIFAHDSPRQHPSITDEERNYIEMTVKKAKYKTPPWRDLLLSRPVWAFVVVVLCDDIGFVFNSIPIYFKQILHLDIKENGFFTSGPMILTIPVHVVSGFINDYLIAKKLTTTTFNRKLFSLLGEGIMALALIVIGFVDCNQGLAIATLFIGVALNSLNSAGFNISALDMAPQYAGTITGIVNGLGSSGGFISPIIVENLTAGAPSSIKWRNVFFVSAAIYLFGAIVFVIFGSGELQPWAREEPKDSTNSKTNVPEDSKKPSENLAETS